MVLTIQSPPAPSKNSTVSPFLKLPPEIRRCIYKLVLEVHQPIQVQRTARPFFEVTMTRSGRRLRPWMAAEEEKRACGTSKLAITAACRLIYLEAIDLYYANNIFECCVIMWLPDFLDSIGTANMNLISEIQYHGHPGDELYTLEQMPGLRTLKVVLGF